MRDMNIEAIIDAIRLCNGGVCDSKTPLRDRRNVLAPHNAQPDAKIKNIIVTCFLNGFFSST